MVAGAGAGVQSALHMAVAKMPEATQQMQGPLCQLPRPGLWACKVFAAKPRAMSLEW